jgi:hypothetical protein
LVIFPALLRVTCHSQYSSARCGFPAIKARAVIAMDGNHQGARKTHPDKRALRKHIDVYLTGVVELTAAAAGRARGDATCQESVPVVIEDGTGGHVAK